MINIDHFRTIDYAALGAHLEMNSDPSELRDFAKRFGTSTDGAMRSLACFALFIAKAKQARHTGDIEYAVTNERNAQTVYERDILPANRW